MLFAHFWININRHFQAQNIFKQTKASNFLVHAFQSNHSVNLQWNKQSKVCHLSVSMFQHVQKEKNMEIAFHYLNKMEWHKGSQLWMHASVTSTITFCTAYNNGLKQGRIQDFSWGEAEAKNWGQFGPPGPQFSPSTGHISTLGLILSLWARFWAKIRIFFIKYQCFGPKNGAFSCRGGGQGPLAPAPGSAPVKYCLKCTSFKALFSIFWLTQQSIGWDKQSRWSFQFHNGLLLSPEKIMHKK